MMQPTPTAAEFEDKLAELKEVKLKLPLRHHVHLHSLKLLKNQSISELVANALDAYFARSAAAGVSVPPPGPAGSAPAAPAAPGPESA